jgi:hypothetical protein
MFMFRRFSVIRAVLGLIVILLAAGLSACAPAARDAGSAAVAASAEAAMAATAAVKTTARPSATPVVAIPSPTATSTPEKTATPQAAGGQETGGKLTAGQSTATAEAVQTATQEALTAARVAEIKLLNQFHQDGSLTLRPGKLIELADFSESLALDGSYRYWEIKEVEPLADYIILSHIVWKYPDEVPYLDAGSCGFVMRMVDDNRSINALLNTTNTLSLNQKTEHGFVKAGILEPWPRFNDQIRTREKTGEADIAIVAERDRVSLYINGYKDSEWVVGQYSAGTMGYMILSASNVGYGVQCSFTKTHVYPLTK